MAMNARGWLIIVIGVVVVVLVLGVAPLSLMLGLLVPMGLLVAVGYYYYSTKSMGKKEDEQDEDLPDLIVDDDPEPTSTAVADHELRPSIIERERIIEREVVIKIKCRYCGTLNDQMAQKCSSCGGSL